MGKSFFTGNDTELFNGSNAFAAKISATPIAYGLTAIQAAAYATVNDAYAAAYTEALDPQTRTRGKIMARNQARAELRFAASDLAKIISGTPTVTDEQRIDLGISVRATPVPQPVPDRPPKIDMVSMVGNALTIQTHDDTGSRRGRPAGVQGCSIFSYVGNTPPNTVEEWTFQGSTSKTRSTIVFDPSLAPGTKVWVTAFWCNSKLQSGPAATPISTQIQFSPLNQAA